MKLIGIEEHYLTAGARRVGRDRSSGDGPPSVAVHSSEIERRSLMNETGLDVQVM